MNPHDIGSLELHLALALDLVAASSYRSGGTTRLISSQLNQLIIIRDKASIKMQTGLEKQSMSPIHIIPK